MNSKGNFFLRFWERYNNLPPRDACLSPGCIAITYSDQMLEFLMANVDWMSPIPFLASLVLVESICLIRETDDLS